MTNTFIYIYFFHIYTYMDHSIISNEVFIFQREATIIEATIGNIANTL